jgi:hypothetical protein
MCALGDQLVVTEALGMHDQEQAIAWFPTLTRLQRYFSVPCKGSLSA